ncbi:MAG TPA: PAS domain S-box protein [Burkholderiaceae bacterium]|nr:PAS domain S-box protein [Burkholderiaceae bacterium]
MFELSSLLARNGLLPHGYCFSWSPGLLWTMVVADLSIASAYFSIPLVILSYWRRRPAVNIGGAAMLFSAFIFACGITHLMAVWTIWQPDYVVQSATKVLTALVSVFTAVVLWRLLPNALRIPSAEELRSALSRLQAEVALRRTTQDHLLEAEQNLAATLAAIGAGFIATDAEGRVTRMNPVAERVTGWSAAEAVGRSLGDVFDDVGRPGDPRALNPVDRVIERGITGEASQRIVCIGRDGTHTPVQLHAEVVRREDGSVRGLALVFRDETRLSQAESDVQRLAAVVESSSDAIIVKTLEGRITNWNAAAERMFGYSAQEAIGRSVQMLIPEERIDEEMRIIANLSRGEVVAPFRTVRLAKDGRRIEVSVQISPIRDAAGRVIGGAKSARDLTHQRQIEAALRRSEARMRFALESAAIGDWEIDLDSGEMHRSRRHDQCFGFAQPLPTWTRDQMLEAVHPDDREAVNSSLEQSIAQRTTWHAEFRVLWPDRSLHWLRMDGQVVPDGTMVERMVGIVTDVTALRTAEQVREQARRLETENQRVLAMSRMKGQFLANMSHELRTPLNAVIGFADLLAAGMVPAGSPKHGEYIGHIAQSGRHLLRVINDVLDLSKIEAGKLEFQPLELTLPDVVDEVVATLGMQAAAQQLRIVSSIAPDVRRLRLDPHRLKQVLFNFLSNAVKFTPPGGRIDVRAVGEGPAHWRLEVIDTGPGIAAEDIPRLFVEFQQLDGGYGKRHQGTGLGLALTRSLVEAQGGRVGVYSAPGAGSTFYAVLPRDASAAPDAAAPRVLVATHDHPLRDHLARAMALRGLPHDAVGSAAEVIRLARVRHYDALTIDLALPDGQGLSVVAELRQHGGAGEHPVRALAMSAPLGGGVAYGVTNVLPKPLTTDTLGRAWATLTARTQGEQRVLVVDDDPMARDLMQAALDALGIASVTVEGGAQALARIDEVQPTAVVLDLMMPDVDGFQVLHALRRQARWRELPVFVWTAMTLDAHEQQQLAASVQAIVSKGDQTVDAMVASLLQWLVPPPAPPNAVDGGA